MGFVLTMVLLLGGFGLALWANGMAHLKNNDGIGGGQVMVGGFLTILSIIFLFSLMKSCV